LQSVPSQLPHYLYNKQPFLTIVSNLFLNVVWSIHTVTDCIPRQRRKFKKKSVKLSVISVLSNTALSSTTGVGFKD